GTGVPLLPKVRGQFAECLDRGSLGRLGSVLPAHLCRFAVRASGHLAPGLFWAMRARSLRSSVMLAVARSLTSCPGFHPGHATKRDRPYPLGRLTDPLASPRTLKRCLRRCRTVDLLSIAYASRPRLRPD